MAVLTLISDEIDFKLKPVGRDEEKSFTLTWTKITNGVLRLETCMQPIRDTNLIKETYCNLNPQNELKPSWTGNFSVPH